MTKAKKFPTLAAASCLAACTVGPDYQGPPNAAPVAARAAAFHRAATADALATDPPARWWESLGDPLLDRLVATAMANNPTIEQNEARLRNARATVAEQRAGLLPKGGANALAVRTQEPIGGISTIVPGAGGLGGVASAGPAAAAAAAAASKSIPDSITTNLFDASFDASWELDVFGGTRRAIEAARDAAGSQAAELADAQVQLAAELVKAYINLRDAQRRLVLVQQSVAIEQRQLDLTRQRRALGTAADADVARLETQAEQSAATAPTLQAEIEQYIDRIVMLEGAEPGPSDDELDAPGALPLPPPVVAVGNPAAMLRCRPDIRAAERQLAADTAQIGQQVAQYFPSVTLFGTIGFTGNDAGRLFNGKNFTYLGGPSLTWNIFNFPQISARMSEAKATRDAAAAQYRNTVLSALQDAETALSRFGHARANVFHLAAAEAAAAHSAAITQLRTHDGTASLIDTLDAERQRMQTEQSLSQAQAMLTNDYVALQKAMGLGWSVPENGVKTVESLMSTHSRDLAR